MAFPAWAPATLVEEYNRLQTHITNPQPSDPGDEEKSAVEVVLPTNKPELPQPLPLEEQARVLHRLLTHPDMKSVWVALSRPSTRPKLWNNPPYDLWSMVESALRDFRILTAHPQTPAERRKSLLSIVSKAKALQEAITAEPLAKWYAKQLVAIHLARKNLDYRRDEGEIPFWYEEEQSYVALGVDCINAFENREIRSYEADHFVWHETPLVWRLGYWTREAKDTSLDDLLQIMMEALEEEARVSPDIKQPGRGDRALKAFLIRRMSSTLYSLYEQPLDELTARIVTVVLNLQTPLTRDDIRPYLVPPGRKQRKSI